MLSEGMLIKQCMLVYESQINPFHKYLNVEKTLDDL